MRPALRLTAAIGAAAVVAAAAQSSIPTLGQSTVSEAAYNYDIDPFHCDLPSVDISINASYAIFKVTYYNEQPSDNMGAYPFGRTTYTYATFDRALAYQPLLWDPADPDGRYNPTLASAFAPSNLPDFTQPLTTDAHLYKGMCDSALGSTSPYSTSSTYEDGVSGYPRVSNLTQPVPTGFSLTSGLTTSGLFGSTQQVVGCECVAFAYDSDGVLHHIADQATRASADASTYTCVDPTGATDSEAYKLFLTSDNSNTKYAGTNIFNSTYRTNGWGIRQSTCASSGSCGTSTPSYGFAKTTNAKGCGLKTEAMFVIQTSRLGELNSVSDEGGGTSAWSMYTVELGSTSNFTGNDLTTFSTANFSTTLGWPVDSFVTRVTEHRFQLTVTRNGAITIPIDAGDMLPPMMMRVMSVDTWRASANTATVVFILNTYVRQPNTISANDTSPLIVLDPAFMAAVKPAFTFTPEPITGSTFTTQCDFFAVGEDGTRPMNGTKYACDTSGCTLLTQTQLPTFITSNFNPATASLGYYWLQYAVAVQCNIIASNVDDLAEDFVMPATTIRINYGLRDTAQDKPITDQATPPYVQFQTYFTLPGQQTESVTFPLVGSVFHIDETSISTAQTLSDVVYSNDVSANDMAALHRFAYSEALGFKVQLANEVDRTEWQVRPQVVLMLAQSRGGTIATINNQQDIQSNSTSFDATNPLGISFCGLDQPDIVAAFVLTDSATDDGLVPVTVSGGVITAMGIRGDLQQSLSPALNAQLALIASNNAFTNVSLFQGSIVGPAMTGDSSQPRAFVVPDYTGGFVVPLRNRLNVNGVAGTYAIKFCSIVQMSPYTPFVRGGYFPVYPTVDAALRDSDAVSGSIPPPVAIYGSAFAGTGVNAYVKYYMPVKPISTSSLTCKPAASTWAGLPSGIQDSTSSACANAISALTGVAAGRRRQTRRLLATEFTVNSQEPAIRKVTQYSAQPPVVLFEASTEATGVASPPNAQATTYPPPALTRGISDTIPFSNTTTSSNDDDLSRTTIAWVVVVSVLGGIFLCILGVSAYMEKKSEGKPSDD